MRRQVGSVVAGVRPQVPASVTNDGRYAPDQIVCRKVCKHRCTVIVRFSMVKIGARMRSDGRN